MRRALAGARLSRSRRAASREQEVRDVDAADEQADESRGGESTNQRISNVADELVSQQKDICAPPGDLRIQLGNVGGDGGRKVLLRSEQRDARRESSDGAGACVARVTEHSRWWTASSTTIASSGRPSRSKFFGRTPITAARRRRA